MSIKDMKSLYPALVSRLFYDGVFDTAETRNQKIFIIVDGFNEDLKRKSVEYEYESVIDIPFELLQMACYSAPTRWCKAYRLCGLPDGIEGQFVLEYTPSSPFSIRTINDLVPSFGIIVSTLTDDCMEVLFFDNWRIVRLPRNKYGQQIRGRYYFRNMNEFCTFISKEGK